MSIIPIFTSRVVIAKLLRAGFRFIYARGSHYVFKNTSTSRMTTVPVHGGKDIGRPLLSKIIKQAGIPLDRFLKL